MSELSVKICGLSRAEHVAVAVEAGAKYLAEQIALAITQRASGEDPAGIRQMLDLALSVLTRP